MRTITLLFNHRSVIETTFKSTNAIEL